MLGSVGNEMDDPMVETTVFVIESVSLIPRVTFIETFLRFSSG